MSDSWQRAQARDPSGSFIVQAPAGSGKTELLTQRYLRLLGLVKAPEQIIALTFTRKAASEMRQRVIQALQKAAAQEKPSSPHQQQTFDYAKAALARSQELNWQVLEQVSRLRILTLDSLCQTIAHALPLQNTELSFARISENPTGHYQEAASACFAYALEDKNLRPALKILLLHLDNRQDKLLELLADLLASREQWLPSLYLASQQDKRYYEEMLARIEAHELKRFRESLSSEQASELVRLARQVASIENNPNSARFVLRDWQEFSQINKDLACGLAALLLTADNRLRKGFDHHVGLRRDLCEAQVFTQLKAESQAILAKLSLEPDFLAALLSIKNLPQPQYEPEQWEVLQALFSLLPLLVAHLQLVFSEQQEVDFAALSQQALHALGDETQPTDLALYLDNSLQHILVDEFQDTSIQQFQLLSKLVQGWEVGDGRTLFLVGDPMQSIYRFRGAEVGLFLKAREEGLGTVRLQPLSLDCNFRSTPTLVNWVNQQFQAIFPQKEDMQSGAISFHSGVALREDSTDSHIKAWQLPNRQQEAQAILKLALEDLEAYPQDELAILVRSRNQLVDILSLLRQEGLPFQGVSIELLTKLPHLRDLFSLTQALLRPANRLAWLALLRSPFCGLTLADLHALANFDPKKSLYYALSKGNQILELSEEGRCRAQCIYEVLHSALASRHQQPLVDWIVTTLKELQGELILDEAQQEDVEQFCLLLERFTQGDNLLDFKRFSQEFSKLYSQKSQPARLKVMTIHESKGLEFDAVLLPGLSSRSQPREQPLLRWLKLPSQNREELLLVSPLKAAWNDNCRLYNYLGKLDAEKDHYELQRLFYVAATRAKKRLYLFDSKEKESQGSLRSFLIQQEFTLLKEEEDSKDPTIPLPSLYRLPKEFYRNPPPISTSQRAQVLSPINDSNARQLGLIAHEVLQWICDHHPTKMQDLPWSLVSNQLKQLGLSEEEQTEAESWLDQLLGRLFKDPIGLWLCKAHKEERNEYALLVPEGERAATRIIDRTFIEAGQRWVIDFKTGSEDKAHYQQVNLYAELLANKTSLPIRCGLYYLASGNWITWDYLSEPQLSEPQFSEL